MRRLALSSLLLCAVGAPACGADELKVGECPSYSAGNGCSEGYVLTLEAFGGGPGDHVFDLTSEERQGILAYMRAIPPEGVD